MKKIVCVRNTSELGAGTRGASLGPGAIEVAAHNRKSNFFSHFQPVHLPNHNHLLYNPVDTPFAKHIEGISKVYETVSNEVAQILKTGDFPFILAGDHSSAGGTIAGIKKAFPGERLGVVWIDAHGDLHSPYTSPSGNVHGMPIASALGEDNKKYQLNDVVERTYELWEHMKNLHSINPKIQPQDLLFFGVRDTEEPEDGLMEDLGIKNYTVEEIKKKGAIRTTREAIETLVACDKIYLSFDVDVMDCDKISHGTGTPVPNGLLPEHVTDIIRELLLTGKVCCLEVVEINPTLDEKKNKMAEAALDVLLSVEKELMAYSD